MLIHVAYPPVVDYHNVLSVGLYSIARLKDYPAGGTLIAFEPSVYSVLCLSHTLLIYFLIVIVDATVFLRVELSAEPPFILAICSNLWLCLNFETFQNEIRFLGFPPLYNES